MVEIDLCTDVELENTKLFDSVRTDSIFAIQVALRPAFEPQERRFGFRSPRGSVSSEAF